MSDGDYKIDLFKPDDAPGVAQLFSAVYGDGYPVKIVYNPEQLVAAFQNNEYIPVLARTPDNRIVGFTSLYRSAPHKGVYEAGLSLVLPEYRNTLIYGLMSRRIKKTAPAVPGLDVIFVEAVCNHTLAQEAGIVFKQIETAIEIDLMPVEAYERENAAPGRVSTSAMFGTIVPKPHVVYVSEDYEEYFHYVYDGFDDSRTVTSSTNGLPSAEVTELATQVFDFAQLARVTVHRVGADFETVFNAEENRIGNMHCTIIQVWLKLTWPWIGEVIGILRNRGFFLGGILPRWFDEDGFLLQKVCGRPNWEGINLYSDRAKQILRFIKNDWERTRTDIPC